MLRYVSLLSLLLNSWVNSFTSISSVASFSRRRRAAITTQRTCIATVLHSNPNIEILVISVDSIVLDTTEWRIQQGIQAAVNTWPYLLSNLRSNDNEWLVNKMAALAHIMTTHVGASPTCDYALLARLLLEEQELDRRRSVGKTGKYASRFHPSTESVSTMEVDH